MRISQLEAMPRLIASFILLILFFAQGFFFIDANTATYDEAAHLAAGYSYLARRDFRLNPEHPPLIKQLVALPLVLGYGPSFKPDPQHWSEGNDYLIGRDLLYKSLLPADRILLLSRLPNLMIGGILVALTGWWAYRLWGKRAAMLAMTLACFEPNLIAHSSLVTTDIGITLFIFLTIYLFWEYLNFRSWWLLVATGISTGMALISKFSALLLIPMIAVVITATHLSKGEPHLVEVKKSQQQAMRKPLKPAVVFCLILFVASLMIPPGYFLQGFSPWLHGLEKFLTHAQDGHPAFFLGEHSYQGWWNYFLVAFLIKTPIGSLLLIAASLTFNRAGNPLRRREITFLLVPVALVFLATMPAKVNIGLRHILPIYPFLFVIASRLATIHFRSRWILPLLLGIPLVFTAISSLRIAPHQLAYFNEFVGGPDQGYRYLSDSNIDWGQDLKGVKAYMEKENLSIIYLSYFGTAPAEYYGIRYQYVPGTWPLNWPPPKVRVPDSALRKILAISVTNLQDVGNPYDPLFRWLWSRQPIAKIGHSIFVYDLTNDPEGLKKLEESYLKAGLESGLKSSFIH